MAIIEKYNKSDMIFTKQNFKYIICILCVLLFIIPFVPFNVKIILCIILLYMGQKILAIFKTLN